jgi:hypothetical protein
MLFFLLLLLFLFLGLSVVFGLAFFLWLSLYKHTQRLYISCFNFFEHRKRIRILCLLCQGYLFIVFVLARNGCVQLHTATIDPVDKIFYFEEKQILDHDAEEGASPPAEVVYDESIDRSDLAEIPNAEHQGREHSGKSVNGKSIDIHVYSHVDSCVQKLREELCAHKDVNRLRKDHYIEEVD